MTTTDTSGLVEALSDEADLCRNDGADDIASLLDDARATIEAQAAELVRLREALEPFALDVRPELDDDEVIETVCWTVRQHRAARAALKGEQP